jgi:hypothetical protein
MNAPQWKGLKANRLKSGPDYGIDVRRKEKIADYGCSLCNVCWGGIDRANQDNQIPTIFVFPNFNPL